MKLAVIFLAVFLLQAIKLEAQFLKRINALIYSSFSAGACDTRMFDFGTTLYGREIYENGKNELDYQFDIGLLVLNKPLSWVEWNYGLGLSNKFSTFSRPYSQHNLASVNTKEGRTINVYIKCGLAIPLTAQIYPIKNKPLFIQLSALSNFTFLKKMSDNWPGNHKWRFGFDNIDLNTGIGLRGKCGRFSVQYRFANLAKIDNVIFDSGLFFTPNPEFLKQSIDWHNPNKFILAWSFPIYRK